ncbi:MAG: hypothetical protein HC771_21300, partial [Synechococcales cyanobacterium CRU_2_2]|nr:hypothetical protein [Synechococcales cyanobacterium CRU_2_2]
IASPLAIAQKSLLSLEKQMNRGQDLFPGLLSISTVTPPLVQHLYQLAADFHQVAPWRTLSDLHPIEICHPPTAKPRYAVVMGSGGEIFGLAVYDSLKDLKRIYNQPFELQPTGPRSSCLMLYFDEAIAMAFDDLDDAAKYDWPIANETAYPVFVRSTPQDTLTTPSAADLFWLEGALEGILTYYNHHQEMERGRVKPADLTLPINTLGAKTQLKLRLPAFSPYSD